MGNKRRKYIRIDSDISNNEFFAMLYGIDSGGGSDVDSILNDSNTEFVSDKPIRKAVDDTHDILVPEANVHVVSELTELQQEDCEVLRKKRKCRLIYGIKWSSRKSCHPRSGYPEQAHAQHESGKNFKPVDAFMKVVNAQELIDHIVSETKIYTAQKGRNFLKNHDELKAFLEIHYLMGITKLPSVANHGKVDHYFGSDGIRNVMTWQKFQDILQNLHLANNDYDGKSDKGMALFVLFGNIYNTVSSKLTPLLVKI